MLPARQLAVALIATVIAFGTLYIPQPLLPLLAERFAVTPGEAGLLMTVTMLPLAFAPICYGYFLQAVPARLLLIVAFALLALDQLLIYFIEEFWQLIGLRLLQGLLLPAIFTALMTYCANLAPAAMVRRAMGFYIGATILGGFGGRLAGGYFASALDWRSAFVVMGLLQLLPLLLLLRVESDTDINFTRLDAGSILRALDEPNFRFMLLSLAGVFFVFSGILNNIPFHLQDLDPGVSTLSISLLYLGYLVGVPLSFCSESIGRRLGDERRGLLLGLALLTSGLVLLLVADFDGLVATMFLLAAGFFLIHALLSGLANHLAREHRGVVNGIYVSVYYFSGALGSWLPGYLYLGLGWHGMIAVLMLILGACGVSIMSIKLRLSQP